MNKPVKKSSAEMAAALRDGRLIDRAVKLAVRDALAAMAPRAKAMPKSKSKPGARSASRRNRAA